MQALGLNCKGLSVRRAPAAGRASTRRAGAPKVVCSADHGRDEEQAGSRRALLAALGLAAFGLAADAEAKQAAPSEELEAAFQRLQSQRLLESYESKKGAKPQFRTQAAREAKGPAPAKGKPTAAQRATTAAGAAAAGVRWACRLSAAWPVARWCGVSFWGA